MASVKTSVLQVKRYFFLTEGPQKIAEPTSFSLDKDFSPLSWHKVWLLLVILLSGILAYFSLHNGHAWSSDFALYVRQAESLLTGSSKELLALNRYAMENSVYTGPPIGPHLYPWGFPLLLSPIYALLGPDIFAMKICIVLFLLLSLVVVWHLFRERLGKNHALLLVALLGFNPYLIMFTNNVVSDIPFLFFALLSLLFIQKIQEGSWVANKPFTYALTGFAMLGAYLIRSNGIVLPLVLLLSQLMVHRGDWRESPGGFLKRNPVVLLPYVCFGLGILLAKALLPTGSGSYLSFFSELSPGKIASNLVHYMAVPTHLYHRAVSPAGYPVAFLLYLFTLPFAAIGVCRHLLRDFHYVIYVVLLLAIVIVFPIPVYVRLIFSALPFYLYFTFQGLMEAEAIFRRRRIEHKWFFPAFRWERLVGFATRNPARLRPSRFILMFCLLVLPLFILRSSADAFRNMKRERAKLDGPYAPKSQQMLSFVKNSTPSEAVVIFHKPRAMSMFTQRQSLRVTKLADIEAGKGDYLVYHIKPEEFQVPLAELEQIKARHPVVFENEEFIVFQLKN